MNRWKVAFFSLLAILVIIVNITVWFLLFKKKSVEPQVSLPPTPTLAPSPATPPKPILNQEQIKQSLLVKTGIPQDYLSFSVGKTQEVEGRLLISGGVKDARSEVGGAGFFAVCEIDNCFVVYTGQGVPECSAINPYNFPKSWADYCLDATGKTIKR